MMKPAQREAASPRRLWFAAGLAVILSLTLNICLRLTMGGYQLGLVADDFTLMASNQTMPPGWRWPLADEPLFLLWDAARVTLLGTEARPHYLMLGLLLTANALLAFWLVARLGGDALFALTFLVFFLTQPNRGEAEYWISSPYPLVGLLLLASLHLALGWLRQAGRSRYAGCWFCYALAVFTHESALGFAAVAAALWAIETRRRDLAGAARFLAPFAVTAASYLVLRQTQWFGLGYAGIGAGRPIAEANWAGNLKDILGGLFGSQYLASTEALIRQGSAAGDTMAWAAAGLLAVLLAAALAGEQRQKLRLAQGLILGALALAGSALFASGPGFPQPFATLALVLRAVVAGFLVAVLWVFLRRPGQARPGDAALWRLLALALAWYFFAFAANLFWYVANRHFYLPSVGTALLLACLLCLPISMISSGWQRDLATGAAVVAVALVGGAFHLARRAEAGDWREATRTVRLLERQLREQLPAAPAGKSVIILDLTPRYGVAAWMPPYGVRDALRLWYRDPALAAGGALIPYPDHFEMIPPSPRGHQRYEDLLLFSFHHERLERIALGPERKAPPGVAIYSSVGWK